MDGSCKYNDQIQKNIQQVILYSKSAKTIMFRGTWVVKEKGKKEIRRVVTCRWEGRDYDWQRSLRKSYWVPTMSYSLSSEVVTLK